MKSATLSLLLLFSVVPLFGQVDPPDRIGWIGYMSGSVSFQPAGVENWVPALRNRPITTGDQVWVDNGARAEIHVGSTALRLGWQTAFQFLNLNNLTMQIRLSSGSLNVRVRYQDDNQSMEVDTPNMAFSILHPGDYRIDVQPDAQTTLVTVREGDGEITGGGQAFNVHRGERASVTGSQPINVNVASAPEPDKWDRWCMDREEREERSPSLRYMHPEMAGYGDLDENGYWQSSPYGQAWVPRNVPPGWAPYHYGHWAWIHPWGWSWVDNSAWGFAPFHYGRWAYWDGHWGWIPGPVETRPVYAPAQVAWIGGERFGPSMSFGTGAVAWVPLGPREVYVPPYQVSPGYMNRINNSNNINVTNAYNTRNITAGSYANAHAPNGVFAMSPQAMGSAQSVNEVSRPVPPAALASAQVTPSAQVAPQLQGVLGPAHPSGNVPHPPAGITSLAVVAKTPPPRPPIPFAQSQQALQRNPGVPLNQQQTEQIRQVSPPVGQSFRVKQAPAAAVIEPPVAPNPPQSGMPVRPGGSPSYAPPASHPGAPVAQPWSRPPGSGPAQETPAVTQPTIQPPSPASAPTAQPPHPPTPPAAPTPGTPPPPKVVKKPPPPPPPKDKGKDKH